MSRKKKKKKLYQLGGVFGGPSEVEGGEVLQLPNSDLVEVQGPSHAQGGVDLPLPEGTVVFSEKLKGPDGESFAERKKKRDRQLKKAFAKLEDDPFDVINRFTLERVMENAFLQESTDLSVQNMANFVEEYAYGGKVKYEKGGKVSNKISKLVGEGDDFDEFITAVQQYI